MNRMHNHSVSRWAAIVIAIVALVIVAILVKRKPAEETAEAAPAAAAASRRIAACCNGRNADGDRDGQTSQPHNASRVRVKNKRATLVHPVPENESCAS